MRIFLVLLSILPGLAWSGCNSRASFPENNGNNNNVNNQNCSNGELEPGEACDLDHALTPMFQEGDSCVNRGYAGGDLICEPASCQVITSNCIPSVTDCGPIYDTGCDELNCYYFPETDETACADHGEGTEGTFCDSPFQCAPRHTCFENSCRKVCNPGSIVECTGNLECENLGWLGGDLGICPLEIIGCDPVSGGGCPSPQGCYLVSALGGGRCAPAGGAGTGEACGPDTDCVPGHVCLKLIDSTQGYCTRLCDVTNWCDNGSSWCAFYPGVQAGFCPLEPASCNPMMNECPDEQVCTVINPTGTTSCMLTQGRGENESCDMFTRCAQGLYCAMELDMKCHRLCQAEAECGDQTCVDVPGWQGTNGLAGYCQ
jgi:hypothetical protein